MRGKSWRTGTENQKYNLHQTNSLENIVNIKLRKYIQQQGSTA